MKSDYENEVGVWYLHRVPYVPYYRLVWAAAKNDPTSTFFT